ncbi:putative bifunctional diguanylate cyclase/phosphodiesterase [uncultured Jatrophihabitans sp.]|uniref:putative bifunctional diguanylate cyclase/phosphodiesterase n=1 Tax=uncultured Jatrophihabitans sp. TaxID=1610747 RepID=UPI0035C9F14B
MRLPGGIARATSVRRLFAVYAAVTLVPVVVLGAALLVVVRSQADSRGLSDGVANAKLIEGAAVSPIISQQPLGASATTLPPASRVALSRAVRTTIAAGQVLRLRLRNLAGRVVYASDGSSATPDDDNAEKAANGHTVAELTRLNADDASGPRGPRAVEVYLPLRGEARGRPLGVLEMYVPYSPIALAIERDQRGVLLTITGGLLLLWLCLVGVSASVMGRLRRESEANAFLATHDALTGAANRAQFTEWVSSRKPSRGRDRAFDNLAIALLDLSRFRLVNDTLGWESGDEVIAVTATRIAAVLGEDDGFARLGGAEFGVLLRGRSAGDVLLMMDRLRAVVAKPMLVGGAPLAVEASVGFTIGRSPARSADQLLREADVALTTAKREHSPVVRFSPELDRYDSLALALLSDIRGAIERDELVLHFQPKHDVRTGAIVGAEALVRWQHPTRGLLYPDAFIGALEQTELIEDLTRWVIRTTCQVLPSLDPEGLLRVAVNVSARSLLRPHLADELTTLVTAAGMSPSRLALEITETSIMTDPERAARTVVALSAAGFAMSVDDFGAGQTSLSYLVMMPFDELKIDRAFVMSMRDDPRNAAIVRTVIELGRSLGLSVTAEGAETTQVLDDLAALGCDTAQGYLFSRPVSAVEFALLLHRSRSAARV